MLVSSHLYQVPTVERLVNVWANRYLPDLSLLSIGNNLLVRSELREAALSTGRARTVAKLPAKLIEDKCKLAAIRVKDLYYHLPQGCDLMEATRLAKFASCLYLKLLEVYQQSPNGISLKEELQETFGDSSLAAWGIPKIAKLAATLEPLLLEFQAQYLISKDWRSLGFITTQINFSNALLLEQLTPVEQVLISPYFTFIEEQVALPWQRICAAAVNHDLASPVFAIVEQMLPKAAQISAAVYDRLRKAFPHHSSRRGKLNDAAIKHSCLRDFSMFQAYLWLAVLQGNLRVVEQELVALCVMVLECMDVSWQTTIRGTQFLTEEILKRLDPEQVELVQPFAEGMLRAFDTQNLASHRLAVTPQAIAVIVPDSSVPVG